jgi:endonuclease/exonuclease/phosphatase family metal-dependent hydrolase
LRLLTWNLFHGRDYPPNRSLDTWRSRLLRTSERDATHVQVNRSLRAEFAAKLAGWDWDVALLQEAPPRWLGDLEHATGARGVRVLTSRNSLAPLRAAIADRNPDLIASNEGGSNILLVRPPARILATASALLATHPERRVLSLARVDVPEPGPHRRLTIANTHLSVPSTGAGTAEVLSAATLASDFAGDDPLVFGGDLNLRPRDHRSAFDDLRDRFELAPPTGPGAIDHLLARSLAVVEPPAALPAAEREVPGPGGLAIRLSDHAPVVASFGLR